MTTRRLPYTFSEDSLSVYCDSTLHTIPSGHPGYTKLIDHLTNPDGEHDLDFVRMWIDKRAAVSRMVQGNVEVVGDEVFYKGAPVRTTLTEKLVRMLDSGQDATRWGLFLDNLMQNPNPESRECVFNFLERHATPLTEDGCFLAWKYVSSDFKSMHPSPDGTHLDHTPGNVVRMPREQCDSDRNETCSRGLHVCASPYLDGYTLGQTIVMCKVNPRDVVAVPTDYAYQKMRCCEYYVVEKVSGQARMNEVDRSLSVDVGPDQFADTKAELAKLPRAASQEEFDTIWERNVVFPNVDDGSYVAMVGGTQMGIVENFAVDEDESDDPYDEDYEGEEYASYCVVWQDGTVTRHEHLAYEQPDDGLYCVRQKQTRTRADVIAEDREKVAAVKQMLTPRAPVTQSFERNGVVYTARQLVEGVEEHGQREYSRRTGIPRSTLQGWLASVEHDQLEIDEADEVLTFLHAGSGTKFSAVELANEVQQLGQREFSRKYGVPRSTLQGWLAKL